MDAYEDDFSGGFEEGFETEDPNFQSTYYALKLLDYSSSLVSVNESMVIDFILNCQVEDGSWVGYKKQGKIIFYPVFLCREVSFYHF